MEENVVKSQKINYNKKIRLGWLLLALLLAVTIVISVLDYSNYKEIQEVAVASMLLTSDKYDKYQDNYNEMVRQMYLSFQTVSYASYNIPDYMKEAMKAANEATIEYENALDDVLESAGYDTDRRASSYLEHTNFFDYTIDRITNYGIFSGIENIIIFVWLALFVILIFITICYEINKKFQMTVYNDRIVCQSGKAFSKEFFIKDIKSVELCGKNGLKLRGNGVWYRISMLENSDELKTAIMIGLKKYSDAIGSTVKDANADSIVKYKELLDAGIITQEEFDAKKKQLLGL